MPTEKATIRVDYDTQPEEIMDRVTKALQKIGVSCKLKDAPDDQVYLEWEIAYDKASHQNPS